MVASPRTKESDHSRFDYESELVAAAIQAMSAGLNDWGVTEFALEFDYRCGRTDIVALSSDGTVIAIEAKLRDWRGALQQAFRNTSFASESYVLMPTVAVSRALANADEFTRRGVGVCIIEAERLRIVHSARRYDEPLLPALSRRAAAFASSSGE